uniref:Uncharacterized protein n=1 Tax=Cyanothece sp. (strain PCC 7425 / ATCC 29141) TaxID=395961 RepID=B8HTB1_CYAP4
MSHRSSTEPFFPHKPLGAYLVEAGLLSQAQVEVILADQQFMEMAFGEIAATRGWVKQQTIEYVMQKVILPERARLEQKLAAYNRKEPTQPAPAEKLTTYQKTTIRQTIVLPDAGSDSKGSPSSPSSSKAAPTAEDDDIVWAG